MIPKDTFRTISRLTEDQAKDVLLQLAQSMYETDDQQEYLEEILLNVQVAPKRPSAPNSVHIVSGHMAAPTLRHALSDQIVICLEDNLSIGPLRELHTPAGINKRKKWLSERIYLEEDYSTFEEKWQLFNKQIYSIPSRLPIYVWAAQHAGEQLGAYFTISLLEKHPNEIYVIPSTEIYRSLFDSKNRHTLDVHTGEMSIEQILQIANYPNYQPMTTVEKHHYKSLWKDNYEAFNMLRIYKDNHIQQYDEDMLDEVILESVKDQSGSVDYVKAARVVGEVYGKDGNQAGDAFIESRLIELIISGKLEKKGNLKALRSYSVRLKK